MNQGYYSVFDKYTPFVLSHQRFAIDKPLALQALGLVYQWQTSSELRLRSYIYMSNTPSSHDLYIYSSSLIIRPLIIRTLGYPNSFKSNTTITIFISTL